MSKRVDIMLCYPLEEKRLLKWEPPYMVQPKLDGVRCRALMIEKEWFLISSEGNFIYSVPHILNWFQTNMTWGEWDGELYYHGWNFGDINSVVSRTVNLHPEYDLIQFHVFDLVNESAQISRTPVLFKNLPESDCIKHVKHHLCHDLTDIMRAYDYFLDQGYEGIIVRNLYGNYVRKRSTDIMKFKPKKSDYYKVIGWEQMKDKYGQLKPMLGSLTCIGNDYTTFNVGSGLNDDFRKTNWPDPYHLLGKYCHVQYQHLTPTNVPRFPVYVEIVEPENVPRTELL